MTPAKKTSLKTPSKTTSSKQLLTQITSILEDNKADDMRVLELIDKGHLTDYMVVVTGGSSRHVASIAENLTKALKQENIDVITEGMKEGNWVVLDAIDVMVHIMREEVRSYYNIEGIWGESQEGSV